jgi:Fe-S-cluster containining protein
LTEEICIGTAGTAALVNLTALDCRTCGACCSYSRDWPRFTLESDAFLDRIPGKFVNVALSGLRCTGARCSALTGEIGVSTSYIIYAVRPLVCRACEPGDDACGMARRWFRLHLRTEPKQT